MSIHGFGRNYLHETLMPLEGETPVETPEGEEVTIYVAHEGTWIIRESHVRINEGG